MLVAGLLVAGTVVGFFVWRSGQRAIEAEEALSAVKMQSTPGEAAGVGAADALVKVAQEYAGTPAAAKALLRAGTAYFSEGNYARAQEQFNSYIEKHGDTPWVSQAVFGQAAALDAQNKAPEAITKYNDFLRSFPNDPSVDQARLNLARIYGQTQQPALALETLNKITGAQPGSYSPAGAEAEEKKRELLAKNPALAPAPAPMTPNTPNMLMMTNMVRASNAVMRMTNAVPKILQAPSQPVPVK